MRIEGERPDVLFLVAAILSASIHLAGVVEVPGVPPAASAASPSGSGLAVLPQPGADVTLAALVTRSDDAAPSAGVVTPSAPAEATEPLAACAAIAARPTDPSPGDYATDPTAEACLDGLARASSSEVSRWAASFDADGDTASTVVAALTRGVDAPRTAAWWAGLDGSRQLSLTGDLPGVVGELEGVPYDVRDQANRLFLAAATSELRARLDSGLEQDGDAARLGMLQQVQLALRDHEAGDADRQLVVLDTVMPGRAAVAIGHLDTADDVSVLVPGMFFTVGGQLVDWSTTAGELWDEQRSWSYLLGRPDAQLDTTAVVAWMGYRTPDLTNVYDLGLATAGAERLEDAISGLDAARASDPARVTVIAHSYGSTTATLALSSGRVSVDSLALLGSPGSVVPTVGELAVTDGDVYAAAGSFDPVAGSGYFGADPATGGFGAVILHTGGGADSVTGRALGAALGHNDYLRPGTESLRSLALVGLGRGDLVDGRAPSPDDPTPAAPDISLVRPQDVLLRD